MSVFVGSVHELGTSYITMFNYSCFNETHCTQLFFLDINIYLIIISKIDKIIK